MICGLKFIEASGRISSRNKHRILAVSCAVALALAPRLVRAAPDSWTAGPGEWADPGNWSTGVPQSTDDAINTTGAAIDFNTNDAVNSVLSNGALGITGGTLGGSQANSASTIEVDNTLTFNGGGVFNATILQGVGGSVVFDNNGNNNLNDVIIDSNASFGSGAYSRVYNTNVLNAAIDMASTSNGIQLNDANALLTVSPTGEITGYGSVYQNGGGATLEDDGLISANTLGQVLSLETSNITGTGVLDARDGGTLSIGGTLNGTGIQVNVDSNPASLAEIDGGGLTGTLGATTGTGLSFSGNGNNFISGATINGTLTFGSGAFAEVYNANTLNGSIVMASTSNGIRLQDGNALLTVSGTGSISGFGDVYQNNGGATLQDNGLLSANTSGQTLYLNPSNITGSGTLDARDGGILSIGGLLNGSGIAVNVDSNPGSEIEVNGGGLTGNIASTTGTGLSFSGNGNNYISAATVNGTLTFGSGAFAEAYNASTVNGAISMASTSNGIRLHDGNAMLTISNGSNLTGYGSVYQNNGGATFQNNGLTSANVAGQVLSLEMSNITGSGTLDARNGATLAIGGVLAGTGMQVNVDATPGSLVEIDGGGLDGSLGATTGTGLSFSTNSNNFIGYYGGSTVNGTLTFGNGSFAEVYNGNTINGSIEIASTYNGLRLHDGNAVLGISLGALVHGYGFIYQNNGGATIQNAGTISADVSGQTLTVSNDNIAGSGIFEATGGGILSIGGNLEGNGATVHADTGTVQVNGGGISGTFATSTGSGISFVANGNNFISGASVAGNLTFPSGGFAETYGFNQVGGTIAMSDASNGIRLHDGNATLQINLGGQILGYGYVYQNNGGATLDNNGSISANVSGQTLFLNPSNINGTGDFSASSGGVVSIGGQFNSSNAQINVDSNPGSAVEINGGGLVGTLGATTGTGLSFTGNGNNFISGATVNGTLTFPSGGFAEAYNANTINGPIVMASTSNGIRLHDGNASLNIGGSGSLEGYGYVYQNNGGTHVDNAGTIESTVAGQALNFDVDNFTNSGLIFVNSGTTMNVLPPLIQTGGQTSVDGTLAVPNQLVVEGGDLDGTGIVDGAVNNSGGIVTPGDAPGILTIDEAYAQGPSGELDIELGGYLVGTQFSQLDVSDFASVDGDLNVDLVSNFVPQIGDTFDIVLRDGGSGIFASTTSSDPGLTYSVDYEPSFIAITIQTVPEPTSAAAIVVAGCALLARRSRRRNR